MDPTGYIAPRPVDSVDETLGICISAFSQLSDKSYADQRITRFGDRLILLDGRSLPISDRWSVH
jgi:hypothetical protein